MKKVEIVLGVVLAVWGAGAGDCRPETWFHIIGGNASKEGLAADIAALASAGIGGIQFFHGGWEKDEPWPGVKEMIPCLSGKWEELVKFAERECHRRGMTFKMQNCPGWSMSGGPWIPPELSMRKLVAFEPGRKPAFDAADDYHEIGVVTFPWAGEAAADEITTVTFPNPQQINHARAYEPDADLVLLVDGKEVFRRRCPQGAWQDSAGMTFRLDAPVKVRAGAVVKGEARRLTGTGVKDVKVTTGRARAVIDHWEAKAGWGLRTFAMGTNTAPVAARGEKTLVFGHVNAKRMNGPAPKEGRGWECDKMDARGFAANWAGYLGRLVKAGVKIDGTLVDSWECGCQTWTWKMEEEFARRAGYALRPWLPALFGHVLKSEAETEAFLRDWRAVCSRLVEENYYGVMARLARENGMSIQFETAFGDVVPGDILRYWKFADEPMCEFWHPHDAEKFVGSHNFKPVLPCVSAAHIYGKRRVSAESLTSFALTFDENFDEWKKTVDRHFGRGVTHVVFHTFTHNPVIGGKPPSTSFGNRIGSPFLREQTWWPYLKEFTAYLAFCGRELERGKPAVDILMCLGDDVNHKPGEKELLFGNEYKYDYLNADALATRVAVKDGRIVFPDGFGARVIWVPAGTWLRPETEKRLAELEAAGARVARGAFTPDWPSPLAAVGRAGDGRKLHWYQRRDGDEDVFFLAEDEGVSRFVYVRDGKIARTVDPVTRREILEETRGAAEVVPVELTPCAAYPVWATRRDYAGTVAVTGGARRVTLDLGRVRDWATVRVNGREAARLWCAPYACDVTAFLREGTNEVRVEVTSTWYNALVRDAKRPEAERETWTMHGPKPDAAYHEAGLLGPVVLRGITR